jgi:hypothetical protein
MAVAAVLSLPAHGQDGWLTLDSARYLRSPGPDFTVSCPSQFELQGSVQRETGHAFGTSQAVTSLQIAAGKGRGGAGRDFMPIVFIKDLTRETREIMERDGDESFWNMAGLGSAASGGSFHGSRTLSHRGYKTADVIISYDAEIVSPNGSVRRRPFFLAQRRVAGGTGLFGLTCMFPAPHGEVLRLGSGIRNIPDVADVCSPFFESLTFQG